MKLKAEAQRLYDEIREQYRIDDPGGIALLKVAAESFQLMRDAQAVLDKEGLYLKDRYHTKSHPAAGVLKDAKMALLQALKMLGLDELGAAPVGRPSGK